MNVNEIYASTTYYYASGSLTNTETIYYLPLAVPIVVGVFFVFAFSAYAFRKFFI